MDPIRYLSILSKFSRIEMNYLLDIPHECGENKTVNGEITVAPLQNVSLILKLYKNFKIKIGFYLTNSRLFLDISCIYLNTFAANWVLSSL